MGPTPPPVLGWSQLEPGPPPQLGGGGGAGLVSTAAVFPEGGGGHHQRRHGAGPGAEQARTQAEGESYL